MRAFPLSFGIFGGGLIALALSACQPVADVSDVVRSSSGAVHDVTRRVNDTVEWGTAAAKAAQQKLDTAKRRAAQVKEGIGKVGEGIGLVGSGVTF